MTPRAPTDRLIVPGIEVEFVIQATSAECFAGLSESARRDFNPIKRRCSGLRSGRRLPDPFALIVARPNRNREIRDAGAPFRTWHRSSGLRRGYASGLPIRDLRGFAPSARIVYVVRSARSLARAMACARRWTASLP